MEKLKLSFKFIFINSFILFFIILSIKLTVSLKPLYYFDINYLNIPEDSGFNTNDIKLNYNYLINFITSKNNINFNIPTLSSSPEGKIHFYEVKTLFTKIDYLFYITSFISLIGIYYCIKFKDFSIFKHVSRTLLLIPILLIIIFFINFHNAFNIFHKLLFNNNYWIFDINKDPVIKMLPERFFLHCAMAINIFIIIFSLISTIIYKKNPNI
ncbi:TIGR01906 family membrane protein [Clostridium lundense]|uniref:TIGR01906 family membrane protein n=1 Tax=Clostridium lundense TaxID=319475 RepID=UPI0005568A20|nr:TIGR01906 family membrane protein [Clostridium lundense]